MRIGMIGVWLVHFDWHFLRKTVACLYEHAFFKNECAGYPMVMRHAVSEYIENFYTAQRRHSTNGYTSPIACELR